MGVVFREEEDGRLGQRLFVGEKGMGGPPAVGWGSGFDNRDGARSRLSLSRLRDRGRKMPDRIERWEKCLNLGCGGQRPQAKVNYRGRIYSNAPGYGVRGGGKNLALRFLACWNLEVKPKELYERREKWPLETWRERGGTHQGLFGRFHEGGNASLKKGGS